jgi:ketosteroid isomerase-like protein
MSRENVELVRAVFDAWNNGSLEDVLPFAAEGIEWVEVEGLPGGDFRGKARFHSMLQSLFESWEHYRLEPEDVRPVDSDRVVAILREIGRGRASGAPVESRWGYVMTIHDGRLSRVEAYRDPGQALDAVGLRE